MANVMINDAHLVDIANAIREKNGLTDTYTPGEMATAIAAIPQEGGSGSGGGLELPEEYLKITGNCEDKFASGGWDWFIELYGDKITTENITGASFMFEKSQVKEIPFDLNFEGTQQIIAKNMFNYANQLTTIPKITGLKPSDVSYMFSNCHRLREIPAESLEGIDWSYMDTITSGYSGSRTNTFYSCYSLRSFPMEFLNHGNPVAVYSYSVYNSLFYGCYALDEIVNLPVVHRDVTWTKSAFVNTFESCARAKEITFALQEDGSPYVCSNWKSQIITLSNYVGWANTAGNIGSYNSGINRDTKIVTDDATYQALKNDPDWYTTDVAYSRYNHDSAVNTINSLPDVSASGGTNTIKFKGAAGELTDGGAINTLTDEEIAVAAAKGWTVSLT